VESSKLTRRTILSGAAVSLALTPWASGGAPADSPSKANAERLHTCLKRIYISQHYEDWDPRFLEHYDVKQMIKIIDDVDPDSLLIASRTHNGRWFCDVGLGEMHRGLKGVDQLKAFIDHFHAKGKPVVAYFSTIWDKSLFDLHPDWRQVDSEGRPLQGARSGNLCLNSPYREHVVVLIRELIRTHDIDGVFFDIATFAKPSCYCQSCRRLFHSQHGADIPLQEDWEDPLYRKFVQFRMDSNLRFAKGLRDAVGRVNPKLTTSIACHILNSSNIVGQALEIAAVPDYLYYDPYFAEGYLKPSVCTKMLAAVSRYRPEVSIVTRPGNHNDVPNMKTLDHLRSDAFTALANGGAIQFFDIMWADGTLQPAMWARVRQVFAEIKAREKWLGGTPLKSVAVFYSEKTRLWYGRNDSENRYEANFFGVCRALIEEHIPYDIVTALDAKALAGYAVVVLPNTVCMSEAETQAVREYVTGGGGVVCTEKTSLWNEEGRPRNEYGLAGVIGIHHTGDTGDYSRVYSRFDTGKPPAVRLPADGLMTSWGTLQKVALNGAEALARIVFPYVEPTEERFVNIMANPPAVPSDWPACTLNRLGKGKAIYFAGAVDRDYLKLSFPELRWLIADAVRAVAREPLPLEVKAPVSVEVTAYERDGQLVVHLVNLQPEVGKSIVSGRVESRHQIQEILPVYDIEVTVRGLKSVKGVEQQPEGKTLSHRLERGVLTVKAPRLDCHSMVVIDL